VFRVAVVPFADKTGGAEGLDTLKITQLFASELQRVPSYEVVPIVEVTQVTGPIRIDTNQPELAYALARALHVQAIIVGDVIEYDCYYPPRLGLHCEMYAMVTGEPEAVIINGDEPRMTGVPDSVPRYLRPLLAPLYAHKKHSHKCDKCGRDQCTVHPQPAGAADKAKTDGQDQPPKNADPKQGSVVQASASEPAETESAEATPRPAPDQAAPIASIDEEQLRAQGINEAEIRRRVATDIALKAGQVPDYRFSAVRLEDPRPIIEPWVIRHSRIFEGENLGLARKLKHYYFFRWDQRGGDWYAYTDRMDDYNRFCCNRMIYEMLVAAGGKWETLKGVYIPQPWLPWPWR
jgi:hypothetical protein